MKSMITVLLTVGLVLAFAPIGSAAEAEKSKASKGDEIKRGEGTSEVTKLDLEVKDAIALLKKTDPNMQSLFDDARGYVVFPSVVKGAAGIGAAHGDGVVFEEGARIGTSELTMATLGAQLGGQEYIEVIFFEDTTALDDFKAGKLAMAAQAGVVAAANGAAANANYQHGVLVFTLAKNGLMFEASVGGQRFKFTPDTLTAAK
jgi:lipid-binding SYLF domain-containing protein